MCVRLSCHILIELILILMKNGAASPAPTSHIYNKLIYSITHFLNINFIQVGGDGIKWTFKKSSGARLTDGVSAREC